jgi:hypothetical protein
MRRRGVGDADRGNQNQPPRAAKHEEREMTTATRMIYSVGSGMDAIAVVGPTRVEADADEFFGGKQSRPYRSKVMANPTWGDLMKCAEAQARKTRDEHHVFVEGIEFLRRDGGVTVVRLALGS